MLKHLYCAPTIEVATVETEDIICWTGGHEATGAGGGQLTGSSVGSGVKQDNSTDPNSDFNEGEGAKGITFDFE